MDESIIWEWDPEKDEANRQRHGLSLASATTIFDDPLATSTEDPFLYERRWRTVGMVAGMLTLVVHTSPVEEPATGMWVGRIISARRATPIERRKYEEG